MNFLFFSASGGRLFSRDDAETAQHNHEEMTFSALFPYDPAKVIRRGMRVGYTDSLGVFQTFEVRKCRDTEPDHYQEISAEHIVIAELTDEHIDNAELTDLTPAQALAQALDGTLWGVGNVTATNVSSGDFSRGNVWQAVKAIEQNWNVYITPRVVMVASGIAWRYLDIAPAEGVWRGMRLALEKNLNEAGVTWDDSKLKTALYGYGQSVAGEGGVSGDSLTFEDVVWTATADHPAKPEGQKYIEDPAATAQYGRGGRPRFGYYQNADIEDAETLLEKTWETLKNVSVPDVTVEGTVQDLHRLGAPDVPVRLHDLAFVEIRPTDVVLVKEIIQYTEDLLNPLGSRLTIGAYIPNIIYINRENSRGGGGSGGQSEEEAAMSEFYTELIRSETQIGLKASKRDLDDLDDRLTGLIMVEAGRITQIVSSVGSNGQVTAASIVLAVNNAASSVVISAQHIDLRGYVTASELDAVDAKIDNLTTGVTAAASIRSNSVAASSSFSLGGKAHHNSTITIDGVNFQIVTWN